MITTTLQDQTGKKISRVVSAYLYSIFTVCFYHVTYLFSVGSNSIAVTQVPDIAPTSNKEFLDIQAITEYRLTVHMYVTQ